MIGQWRMRWRDSATPLQVQMVLWKVQTDIIIPHTTSSRATVPSNMRAGNIFSHGRKYGLSSVVRVTEISMLMHIIRRRVILTSRWDCQLQGTFQAGQLLWSCRGTWKPTTIRLAQPEGTRRSRPALRSSSTLQYLAPNEAV